MIKDITRELESRRNARKAKILSGFFKTGMGEYGEGDIFLGISVPDQRKIAKKYASIPLSGLQRLLSSRIHEHRLTALLMLVEKYNKSDDKSREELADFYMKNLSGVNNWDLVDLSAPNILGDYLIGRDKSDLYRLAKSGNLWERRIVMVATYAFIRKNEFEDTLKIAEMLLKDDHDLIHKAVGWMLREVGKRNMNALEKFLMKHRSEMPRTMLRYAIERMPERKRKFYMTRS